MTLPVDSEASLHRFGNVSGETSSGGRVVGNTAAVVTSLDRVGEQQLKLAIRVKRAVLLASVRVLSVSRRD